MKKQLMAMGLAALLVTSSVSPSFVEATNISHTVQSGDTLYNISKQYGVSVNDLLSWNGLKGSVIRIGQTLRIQKSEKPNTPSTPVTSNHIQKQVQVSSTLNVRSKANTSSSVIGTLRNKDVVTVLSESGKWAKIQYGTKTGYVHTDYLKAVKISTPSTPPTNKNTYTVKKGDTLSKIAKANGVTVANIKTWNGLKNDTIYIGQTLTLKKTETTTPSTPPKENEEPVKDSVTTYTVKKGDTLSKIARNFGVSVAQLKQWNGLKSDTIGIGQKLTVKKETNTPPKTPTPIPSTIKNETPSLPKSAPVYPSDGVKGIYVTEHNIANTTKLNALLGLLDRTELNTMVINVKNDDGRVTYDSNSEAVDAYKVETNVIKNTKTLLDTLEKKNVYSIARIVTFKDPYMAQKNKDWAMKKKNGDLFYLDGAYWIDPYNKEYWTYVVNIAKEAASIGFDEIQFDYVRFPSNQNNQVDSVVKFNNPQNKTKEENIAEFLTYAKKELAPYGVKVSADIFAWAIAVNDDAGIGQKWENVTQAVDVTSPMIYPSHYSAGNLGVKDPNRQPYDIVKATIQRALNREKVLQQQGKSVAEMRPWFQDFSQYGVTYDAKKVKAQIQAAKELGVEEYLMWNAQNTYTEGAYKK